MKTGATINHKRAKGQVIQIKIVATRDCQSDHKVSKIDDFSWISYLGHYVWLRIKQKTDNGVPILNTFKRLNIYKCGIVGIGMECSSWWNTCFFQKWKYFCLKWCSYITDFLNVKIKNNLSRNSKIWIFYIQLQFFVIY